MLKFRDSSKTFGDVDPNSLTREEIEEKLKPTDGIQERIKFRRGFGDMIAGRGHNGVALKKNERYLK